MTDSAAIAATGSSVVASAGASGLSIADRLDHVRLSGSILDLMVHLPKLSTVAVGWQMNSASDPPAAVAASAEGSCLQRSFAETASSAAIASATSAAPAIAGVSGQADAVAR